MLSQIDGIGEREEYMRKKKTSLLAKGDVIIFRVVVMVVVRSGVREGIWNPQLPVKNTRY